MDHHRDPADRGAQSLELAAAVPLLLLVATLVVAIGQAVLAQAGTVQLAALAARTAAVGHDTEVAALLAGAEVADVVVDPPSGTRAPGDLVTVTVTRTVPVLWVPDPGLDVTASATFRVEDVP